MDYFVWRFSRGLVDYWRTAAHISAFFAHFFTVSLLAKTIFWPWKRDFTASRTQGFDPKEWFNRHVFNLFSRFLGFLIKFFVILIWLAWEIIWWTGVIVFFPIWILFPLVIILVLLNITKEISHATSIENVNLLVLASSIALIVFIISIESIVFKSRRLNRLIETDYQNPNLDDPWFLSLCAHLLVDPDTLKNSWLNENLKDILISAHLSRTEFDKIANWEILKQVERTKKQCWWSKENIFKTRPLTEDWVFGWTFNLNNFSQNLDFRKGNDSLAIINLKELEILKNALAEGNGVNVVITGETGTGRKRLVENLALDISRRNIPTRLAGKKIVDFQLDNLLATSGGEEDKIYLLKKVFIEACTAGNIILFIPTLGNYLESGPEEEQIGRIDITPILTTFLENAGIQIVTVAGQQELNTLFQSHPNLAKYFKVIQLQEPDMEDCLILLCEKGNQLESQYGKLVTYGAIKKALELSSRYLQEVAMPKRALDFLEEAVSYLNDKNPGDHIIKEAEVEIFASQKIGSPVGTLKDKEKEQLENMEETMKEKIVGQTEAISAVASALRRRRLDLSNPNRPAGCFLFLGPTGVGKTHTAEVLANLYYRGESRMARLDMSEYQGEDGVAKLLGDASSKVEGYFRKILSANPFNLILLDELEKASREVHQLLLQIMEEGMAKTGTGKKLNFRETIIIATSNAESLLIQELVKKNESYTATQKTVIDKIQQDRIFSPELLNRFDEIIVFHPLRQDEMIKIADLNMKDLKKRLLNKEIIISYDEAFIQKLARVGFDPVFGARELRRVVEKQIEDAIAKDFLAGKIVKGKEFMLPSKYLK